MDDISTLIAQLQHKEIGAFPAAVFLGIRIYQEAGGPWPKGNVWGTVITTGLSLGTSLLGGIFWLGLGPQVALAAVVPTVASAVLAHYTTKAAGQMRDPVVATDPPKTTLGRTVDIILPPPKQEAP